MYVANLETILTWKKKHLNTWKTVRGNTGLIILAWTQDWDFLAIRKITRQNDLMKIRHHIRHAMEKGQRIIIYLTFKHIEIHYIEFISRTRKWNWGSRRCLVRLGNDLARQFADVSLMDIYYSSLGTIFPSANDKNIKIRHSENICYSTVPCILKIQCR